MFCLYAIDNVGHGRKLYMKNDGFWINCKPPVDELMKFETEDEAMEWAWVKNPYSFYGAEYVAEPI